MKKSLALGTASALLSVTMLPSPAYASSLAADALSLDSLQPLVTLLYGPPSASFGMDAFLNADDSDATDGVIADIPDESDAIVAATVLGLATGGLVYAKRRNHSGGHGDESDGDEAVAEAEPESDADSPADTAEDVGPDVSD